MNLTRRSFLAGVGTALSGILLSNSLYDIVPSTTKTILKLEQEIEHFHNIRIMGSHDVIRDYLLIRYDIYDPTTNNVLNATFRFTGYEDYIKVQHEPVVHLFKNEMAHRRILVRNLKPLPYPDWYKHPDIVMNILEILKKGH